MVPMAFSRRVLVLLAALMATLVVAVVAVPAQSEPTASVFAQPAGPGGVTTSQNGNVFVTYDGTFSSRLAEFAPNGDLLKDVETPGGIQVGHIGHLDTDASGRIWDVTSDGDVFLLEPDLSGISTLPHLKQLNIDTSNIYDVATGETGPMAGLIQTQFASYGDVAVLNRGNQQDVFVTGLSKGFPFVVRLSYTSFQLQSARVIVASRGQATTDPVPPGIAVNDQGTVMTTLPVPFPGEEIVPERTVAFAADFPQDPRLQTFVLRERTFKSAGMTTDAAGNFYVTGIQTNPACIPDDSGGLVRISASLDSFTCVWSPRTVADSRDVAISPDGGTAYIIYRNNTVLRVSGINTQMAGTVTESQFRAQVESNTTD